MSSIHPTAVIAPGAQLDPTASVGPYAVVDQHVVVGPGCVIGPHVHLTGHTVIGANNRFHAGCVIGDAPQDLKYANTPSRLIIGQGNVFREHVTVHRSNKVEEDTVLGDENFLMAGSHVGHNSRVGNRVILANGALLGGHVTVQDRAFISGSCLVHQFVRIGRLALMQGGSAISKDLPPFTIARGTNGICGLNVVGLRRAGFSAADRLELRRLYQALFRSKSRLAAAVADARGRYHAPCSLEVLDFVQSSKRGVCADNGRRTAADNEREDA